MLYIVDARVIVRVNARSPKEAAELANLDGRAVATAVMDPETGTTSVYFPPGTSTPQIDKFIADVLNELAADSENRPQAKPSENCDEREHSLDDLEIWCNRRGHRLEQLCRLTDARLALARAEVQP